MFSESSVSRPLSFVSLLQLGDRSRNPDPGVEMNASSAEWARETGAIRERLRLRRCIGGGRGGGSKYIGEGRERGGRIWNLGTFMSGELSAEDPGDDDEEEEEEEEFDDDNDEAWEQLEQLGVSISRSS